MAYKSRLIRYTETTTPETAKNANSADTCRFLLKEILEEVEAIKGAQRTASELATAADFQTSVEFRKLASELTQRALALLNWAIKFERLCNE